jgi:hypothetical protein|eukprot:996576-Prymnesium_polylepis.2
MRLRVSQAGQPSTRLFILSSGVLSVQIGEEFAAQRGSVAEKRSSTQRTTSVEMVGTPNDRDVPTPNHRDVRIANDRDAEQPATSDGTKTPNTKTRESKAAALCGGSSGGASPPKGESGRGADMKRVPTSKFKRQLETAIIERTGAHLAWLRR